MVVLVRCRFRIPPELRAMITGLREDRKIKDPVSDCRATLRRTSTVITGVGNLIEGEERVRLTFL